MRKRKRPEGTGGASEQRRLVARWWWWWPGGGGGGSACLFSEAADALEECVEVAAREELHHEVEVVA